MDYIYDIVLNFHDSYYEFYEWKREDKIINVKRIPIYKISNTDYLNIKNNEVIIDRNSLDKHNKMFLLTSSIEVMGVIIDNDGKVIKRSSLLFEEADEILEDKDNIKKSNIKYKIIKHNNNKYISRLFKEKDSYVKKYLSNNELKENEYVLKYIYYDIYNIEEDNTEKIYKELVELSKSNINRLYDGLRRVNLELKNNL